MMEEDRTRTKKPNINFRNWLLSMIKNYERLAVRASNLGLPDDVEYFKDKAKDFQRQVSRA